MTESLSRQLRRAVKETGIDAGSIARQAGVEREELAAVLRGRGSVVALEAVADRLSLALTAQRVHVDRAVGQVRSTVDVAVSRVRGGDVQELAGLFKPAPGVQVRVEDMNPWRPGK